MDVTRIVSQRRYELQTTVLCFVSAGIIYNVTIYLPKNAESITMTIDSIISNFQRGKGLNTGKKLSLAPKRLSLDEVAPYYLDINMIFDSETITNIAISGPYGCGKSSFIKSIDQLDGASGHKFLYVSVPSFVKAKAKNYKEAESLKRKLEKGILDQITIDSSYSNSSHAGISSVCQSGMLRSLSVASYSVIFGVLLISLFNKNVCKLICDLFNTTFAQLFILTIAFSCLALSRILFYGGLRRYIKSFTFMSDYSVELASQNNTAIDSFSDSLLYLISRSEIDCFVFEDIDRFDTLSLEVLEQLRTVNKIVNDYNKQRVLNRISPNDLISTKILNHLRHKTGSNYPIRFFYLVKDDLFSADDRVKFFDYIIPILPFADSFNSGELITRQFDEANIRVSTDLISAVSSSFDSARLVFDLVNELLLYGTLLSINLNAYSSTNDFLFAAVVYKVLFPSDFALFQSSKGLLHSLMNSSAYLDKYYHSAFCEAWSNVLYSEEPISIVAYAIGYALDDGLLEDKDSSFYSKYGNIVRNDQRFPAFLALLRTHRLSFQMVRCVSRSHGDSLSWNDWCYLKLVQTENIPRQQFKPHSCGALLDRISPDCFALPAYRNIYLLYYMFRNESQFETKFDSFFKGLIKDCDIDFAIWYLTAFGERSEFTDSEMSLFASLSRMFLNNKDIEDRDKTKLALVLFHSANPVRMSSLELENIVNNYCKAHPKLLENTPLFGDIGLAFANMNKEGLKFDVPAEDCCTSEVLRFAVVNDLIPISFKLICRAADFELTAGNAPFALSLVFDMAEEVLLNWIDRKIDFVIDKYIDAYKALTPEEPLDIRLTKPQLQHIMSLQNLSPRLRKTLSEGVDCMP